MYRTLQMLADAGEVDVVQGGSGEAMYRWCSREHHHHLVCRSCRRSVEVGSDDVEQWAERVAAHHGFTAPSHVVEIFGLCSSCTASGG